MNIKSALDTANTQLAVIRQEAAEEAKRQTRENWKFAILGIIGGWLANFVFPTEDLGSFASKLLEKRKTKRNPPEKKELLVSKEIESQVKQEIKPELKLADPIQPAANKSNDIAGLLSTQRCPKCGVPMKVGPAMQGQYKNILVYICPNCHETIPFR